MVDHVFFFFFFFVCVLIFFFFCLFLAQLRLAEFRPPPTLAPVKVAIVDSGIDNTLPDFAGQIADARSFVGGSPYVDTEGHGTFVAGEIAAKLDSTGIVGMAYASQLLVAKVVKPDGSIPLTAESDAIRWAADSGAKVINLSLGGLRDPLHPNSDYYSPLEASAVRYAVQKGVVVVAAVGNSDEAPSSPWNYASYPAALPHVIGVSALTQNGDVAGFSNRDPVFNDISAPGVGIFSTFPLALTANRPSCTDQGYSDCGGPDYFNAEGTSFAAPQVSAAAAMLFAVDPALTSSQVAAILEQSADDVNAANGCAQCTVGHDRFSGWGRLDVARAIAGAPGTAAGAGQVRAERRRGNAGLAAVGQDDPGVRDARLLRRPGRRLQGRARAGRAAEGEADGGLDRRERQPRPLEARHDARSSAARRSRSCAPRSRSRREPSSSSRTGRRCAAGTTSR